MDAPVPAEAGAPDAADVSPPVEITCPNAPGLQANAPWPATRRCPGRTASTPLLGPHRNPSVVWSQAATAGWNAEPVIAADGTVYAIDWDRGLVAITSTGTLKWATGLSVAQPQTTPTTLAIGRDGTVYAVVSGAVFAIAPDGTLAWSYDTFCAAKGFEVGSDGSVRVLASLCGTSREVGVILVSTTGTGSIWNTHLALGVSPPSVGPDGSFYFFGIRNDMTTGVFALVPQWSLAWSVPANPELDVFDNTLAWPIVRDDGSIVFVDDMGLHALSQGGTPLWTVSSARQAGALAAGPDGTVYASSTTGGLVAIGPDGTIAWQWGGATPPARPIIDGSGTVYAGTPVGIVAIASDGTQLWETTAAAAPLAIDATGALYALDATGKVLSALR